MKTPVIIDTDIGSDIDDTWALCLALAVRALDVKLICVTHEDVDYKAKLVAKILERTGNTQIPVAIGRRTDIVTNVQAAWLDGFDLHGYRGTVVRDCAAAIADTVARNPHTTILEMGPLTNLADTLRAYPQVKENSRIVAMGGAVYRGYINETAPAAEYNVIIDTASYRTVFKSGWDLTLMPLDVCRDIFVKGDTYRRLLRSDNAYAQVIRENYAVWQRDYTGGAIKFDADTTSSILYDFAPVFYALRPDAYETEYVRLSVTEDGRTAVDPDGVPVRCALRVKNQAVLDAIAEQYLI